MIHFSENATELPDVDLIPIERNPYGTEVVVNDALCSETRAAPYLQSDPSKILAILVNGHYVRIAC